MNTFNETLKNPEMPGVLDVMPQDVWKNHDRLVLFDVRRPDEFTGELGHVQGANLLTLDQLEARLAEVPKDKEVVFICRSGGRSGRATHFARENGYSTVYNMKGGMLLWNELNLPTER